MGENLLPNGFIKMSTQQGFPVNWMPDNQAFTVIVKTEQQMNVIRMCSVRNLLEISQVKKMLGLYEAHKSKQIMNIYRMIQFSIYTEKWNSPPKAAANYLRTHKHQSNHCKRQQALKDLYNVKKFKKSHSKNIIIELFL